MLPRTCDSCGGGFLARLSDINRRNPRFCSQRCRGQVMRGEAHPSWRDAGSGAREPLDAVAAAYVAGVLHGDGYYTGNGAVIGLRVKDEEFVRAFAAAVRRAFGTGPNCVFSGGYWSARLRRKGWFGGLRALEPLGPEQIGAWLRGMFDSEGNAQVGQMGRKPRYAYRRVAMYSTDRATLDRCARYLDALGIPHTLTDTKANQRAGHIGTKPVLELRVRGSRENYRRFLDAVGTTIPRKRLALERIVSSYLNPVAAA
jgi:hypothetical protein